MNVLRYALLAASGGLLLALPAGNANARVQVLVGFNCVQVPSNYTNGGVVDCRPIYDSFDDPTSGGGSGGVVAGGGGSSGGTTAPNPGNS